MPVRAKIMGIVLGLVLVLGLGITWQVRQQLEATLTSELELRGRSIAADLAARGVDHILTNDLYALHELASDAVADQPDVRYVFVLDPAGQVLVHTFGDRFPRDLLSVHGASPVDAPRVVWLDSDEGPLVDVAAPIFGGRAGVARVGLSGRRIAATLDTITVQLLGATALVSLIGIAAAFFLTTVLTQPILQLVQTTQAIGQGDLRERARVWANDEIGHLAGALNSMAGRLEAMQGDLLHQNDELRHKEALRGLLLQRVISAQEDERRRIARELHDETSQALTTVMVGLRLLADEPSAPPVAARAEALRDVVRTALDAVHDLLFELRPSTLDDHGLPAALQRYARTYADKHGVAVDFQVGGLDAERLPSQVETTTYRIVQEALTNVARHAEARKVSLLLERRGGHLIAVVEDDGRGFDARSLGNGAEREQPLGLAGMRERAALAGGSLTIESAPGSGTAVLLDLPLTVAPPELV
ncbi:MAG: HAMP domain-containing protein [Chloroflexota bacterium]|nr:HAMP domain-containing protein [Chloroflexota bacterium]